MLLGISPELMAFWLRGGGVPISLLVFGRKVRVFVSFFVSSLA